MQEKSTKRAERRHENQRLRAKRKNYCGYRDYPPTNPGRALGMLVHTATLCSCHGCGNPRNYYGNKKAAKTIHEQSANEMWRLVDLVG